MGSSISRSSSEAFDCFCSHLRGENPNDTRSDEEILSYIRLQASREINLADEIIAYFQKYRDSGVDFSNVRTIIKRSPLYEEYIAMIPKSGHNNDEEHDSSDLLDPFSIDAMALDLGWTRELASLALNSCQDVSTLAEAFARYRQQRHDKRETQERVIKAIPWQVLSTVSSMWLGE